MTEAEVTRIASQAAKASVEEMFLRLGIEANNPDDIKALQKDFSHLRGWRESTEAIKRQSMTTVTIVLITGVLGLIWAAMTGKFG